MHLRPLPLFAFLLAAEACSPPSAKVPITASAPPPSSWITELDRDSTLVGRIWDVSRGEFISVGDFEKRVAEAHFVLLGEKHDNPDHHVLQARVIDAVVRAGRHPAVAFEMIDPDKQAAIDPFLAREGATPEDFGLAVKWGETSWPPFREYEPIVKVAMAAHLPIVAANLAQPFARAIVHEGLSALDAGIVGRMGLDRALPPKEEEALEAEIRDVHCGALPPNLVAPMALAQRARDATLADNMIEHDRADGVVLISGGGHARRGRGVPFYLGARKPDAKLVSVSLAEVRHDRTDPRTYDAKDTDVAPFDFVWFTPRKDDTDHCKEMHVGALPPSK